MGEEIRITPPGGPAPNPFSFSEIRAESEREEARWTRCPKCGHPHLKDATTWHPRMGWIISCRGGSGCKRKFIPGKPRKR
jgi:hypothetical protein